MRTRLLIVATAAILATGIAVVTGTPEQQAPQLRIEQVQDSLYNIVGSGGNVAVLVTSEGVILIDDKFEENFEEIIENVRSVTDQPVKYVINTHYHADHSGGNSRFLAVAEVISTRNARTNILEQRQSGAPPGVLRRASCLLKRPRCFSVVRKCVHVTSVGGTLTVMRSYNSLRNGLFIWAI